jgi:hypothetical protein
MLNKHADFCTYILYVRDGLTGFVSLAHVRKLRNVTTGIKMGSHI